MTRLLAIAAALALLALAGCGGGDDDQSSDGGEQVATTATDGSSDKGEGADRAENGDRGAKPGSVVTVGDSQFGKVLTDTEGRTLYMFDKEASGRSECFGACADAWPPFFTKGEPQARGGAREGQLGTTDHGNKTMVTYNDHPLYYYVNEGPGEVLCHNVEEFGGLWLVLDPSGDPRP